MAPGADPEAVRHRYFHRLRRAGFEERIERSKFEDVLAQIALLQQGATSATPA